MSSIRVLYYSHTRNIGKLPEAMAEGIRMIQDAEMELKRHEFHWRLVDFDAILIESPTYHHSMTNTTKKFLEEKMLKALSSKHDITYHQLA
ncbi:MAG: hypothetical protein OEX77_07625 [Candidatus Bathyarchaeota archaeon]|nr:hypothetical protein [Candidatus Bathyarchaeota archaeon]MDH5733689.1 hypothetical protein [Candidatus Bathyarchaeota archaeon]